MKTKKIMMKAALMMVVSLFAFSSCSSSSSDEMESETFVMFISAEIAATPLQNKGLQELYEYTQAETKALSQEYDKFFKVTGSGEEAVKNATTEFENTLPKINEKIEELKVKFEAKKIALKDKIEADTTGQISYKGYGAHLRHQDRLSQIIKSGKTFDFQAKGGK
ncbi:MAG: hypothetical protein ACRCY5_08515 [Phocaeicola sp.]